MVTFGEPLGHVITLCGQILGSRTDDDPLPSLPTCPCVRSKRPVCTGTTRTCVSKCARGARTHGDVLNVHTGTFLSGHTGFFHGATQHTPHTTPHTRHNARHNTTQQHDHNTTRRERQRQRQRLRETREEKTKQVKIRMQEKMRQQKTRMR